MHWAAVYLIKCAAKTPSRRVPKVPPSNVSPTPKPPAPNVPPAPRPSAPKPPAARPPVSRQSGPSQQQLAEAKANQQMFSKAIGKADVGGIAVPRGEQLPATHGLLGRGVGYVRRNPGKTAIATLLAALLGREAYSYFTRPATAAAMPAALPKGRGEDEDIHRGMSAYGERGTGGL